MEDLLGSTPNGSAPLYARACLEPFRAAPMKAQVRLASPPERRGGFGTCGWIGAGRPNSVQPTVAADVMPARVHAETRQGLRPLTPDQTHYACGNLELLRPPGRLGLPSTRPEFYATLLTTERENLRAGRKSPGATLPASRRLSGLHRLQPPPDPDHCPQEGSWAQPGATRNGPGTGS